MLDVVRLLDRPAAVGLVDGRAHGVGHHVGVEDGHALHVAGGAADGLDQRVPAAQEALLVRVQDSHQRDLGQIQPFPQQVDAHHHVVDAHAQIAQDLHPLDGVDVAVEIVDLDVQLGQVLGQVFGHALGEGGDQHPLPLLGALGDLLEQVVDLPLGGPHLDDGVQQPVGRMTCSTVCSLCSFS